jgi:hypothetical protein
MVRLGTIPASWTCRQKEEEAMGHQLMIELVESLEEDRDFWIAEIIGKIYFYYNFIFHFQHVIDFFFIFLFFSHTY